jgi:lipopolysaccharide export system protein LptC
VTLSVREVLIAVLLAAAGLVAWWYRGMQEPDVTPAVPSQGRPDYVVEQVVAVMMSEAGRPIRRLDSPELRHYPGADGSELDTPVLRLLEPDAPDWVIRSERAWISADAEEILLEGRVHAERAAAADALPMRIFTSELLVLDDAGYAETDRFVEIVRGEDWLTAVDGMQLWFETPMRGRYFGRVRQRVVFAAEPQASGAPGAAGGQP